jgi:Fic family protein
MPQNPPYNMAPWIWESPVWPPLLWDAAKLAAPLAKARAAQGRVLGMAYLLSPILGDEALANVLIQDGLSTSAIEGETLNAASVRSSVARKLTIAAPLGAPKSRAVDGLIDMLVDAARNHAQPLSAERLCRWQAVLFPDGYSGLHAVRTGELRGEAAMQVVSGSVGRETVHFEAPPRAVLAAELDAFTAWFNAPQPELDGLIRAGIAHLWFVTLHPFEDGNGRLARAVTDMALSQDEQRELRMFSMSAQIMRVRDDYYTLLERTQRGQISVTDWLVWFLEQVAHACVLSETIIGGTLAKARFWLRHQATELNARQRKALNRLFDAMDLDGEPFEGGMNTRKYANLCNTSRPTAYRELADLVAKGCLVANDQGGRSSGYVLVNCATL